MTPNVVKLVETSIYVKDLNRSEKFYSKIIGLELYAKKPRRHAFFNAGQGMLMLFNPAYLKKEKGRGKEGTLPQIYGQGRTRVTFEIDADSYDGWKEFLKKNGVKIEHEEDWGKGVRSMYLRDPDRNVVVLITPGLWPIPAE